MKKPLSQTLYFALDYALLFACLARCSSQQRERSGLIARRRSFVVRLIIHIFWPIVFRSLVGVANPRTNPLPPGASSYVYEALRAARGNTVGERNALSVHVFVEEENAAGLWFPLGNSAADSRLSVRPSVLPRWVDSLA